MSARDKTFIDAYGLELTDQLEDIYTQPAHQKDVPDHGPSPKTAPEHQPRTYRFDGVAQRRALRGPHFDMRRVVARTDDETTAWDTFDMGVIDVGAAWATASAAAKPDAEELVPTVPIELAEPPAVEAEETTAEPSPEIATQVVSEPELPAAREEVAPAPESVPVAEATSPDIASAFTGVESTEPFAPVWEVDRFQWPAEIEQLFKAQTEYFDYAGKKLVAASREGLNILAITSTRRGEGSTTLALCLARAAAGAGAKVGLLDGNLNRSELGEKLGVDFGNGWQAAAAFEQPLAEAAITGLEEGITLFPSAAGPGSDVKSLADERVGQVFRTAASSYDLLIVDAGTADLGTNVEMLDAAIVARDIRHTTEEETLAVATALRNCGVKAVGIAENFSSLNSQRAAA
ncbi:MAG: hypothetical protein H6822_00965 [Planctomycetaceae bacterium]|nr:hypothetical protein [Planctomycetales bacterium]MCB9920716.1 hypothetical protein [Planctomycetaceae bacterium]